MSYVRRYAFNDTSEAAVILSWAEFAPAKLLFSAVMFELFVIAFMVVDSSVTAARLLSPLRLSEIKSLFGY